MKIKPPICFVEKILKINNYPQAEEIIKTKLQFKWNRHWNKLDMLMHIYLPETWGVETEWQMHRPETAPWGVGWLAVHALELRVSPRVLHQVVQVFGRVRLDSWTPFYLTALNQLVFRSIHCFYTISPIYFSRGSKFSK